jgi:hypothetical protein
LRGDFYNGLTTHKEPEPRLGLAYNIKRTSTVLRLSYARVLETPFNAPKRIDTDANVAGSLGVTPNKKRCNQAGHEKSRSEAGGDRDECQSGSFADYHQHDATPLRPQRHANSDLALPSSQGVRNHAIDAHGGENESKRTKSHEKECI